MKHGYLPQLFLHYKAETSLYMEEMGLVLSQEACCDGHMFRAGGPIFPFQEGTKK